MARGPKKNKTARHSTKGTFGAPNNKRDYNVPHRPNFWTRIKNRD